MSGLRFNEREVTLAHFNARKEKHGDEEIEAADLKFEVDVPMTDLGMLHAALQSVLYDPEKLDAGGASTSLRFPRLEPLKWAEEINGSEVVVHWGMTGDGDLVLAEAVVDKFVIAPREGGSVALTFRVQFRPTPDQAGALATTLLGERVRLSIRPQENQGGAQ